MSIRPGNGRQAPMLNEPASRRSPAVPRRAGRAASDATGAGRIGAVDGLRAFAVCGVMAFHFGLGVRGGFLGVDFFFVISGYVITRLLLIEWHRTGTMNRARFWGRRARRLLPAVLALLIVVQVWLRCGAPPDLRGTTNAQTLAALAYLSNWYAIVADVGYWGAAVDATPLTHLWSLAVEEQFYLVWPLLLIAALTATRSRRVVAAVAGAGALASYGAGASLFSPNGANRAYLGTDTRAGALLLGVLCALALTRSTAGPGGTWDRPLPARLIPLARWVFAFAVAALVLLWATASVPAPWLYPGGLAVAGVSAALIIGYVTAVPGTAAVRLLERRPVLWTGRISYSLYLWHWPVHIFAVHRWAALGRPLQVLAEIGATFVLATLSYALIERPARHVRRPGVLAAVLLAGALAALGGAVLAQPRPHVEEQSGVIVHGPGH
ncbi:acyltransferase [Actinoallomurus spadix]|uniref:Acyltransferase n=1 Tax=Actinoallomurus spadix TaxID=79912 RepID=A0ABP3FHL9_9ACTN|nr:acyltransferase [Actinoallomurus spadix]MCO5990029.1 acyltransferase [Actinoallomurus spadix]